MVKAKNEKAKPADTGIGLDLKTNNFTGSETDAFSTLDYHKQIESVKPIIERIMRPGKVIRCYRCFSCNRHYAASRMATALVICRECLERSRDKGPQARLNHLDRIINEIRKYLRGPLEVK